MSIKFKTVQMVNPQDITAPRKFYAKAAKASITDLDELAELVAFNSSMSKTDCFAVLMGLETFVVRELERGRNVRLGQLGTYKIGLQSEGRDTEEEVDFTAIKKAKINFTPGVGIRKMLKHLEYKKAQNQSA
ncbi:DNA-binding protein, histone-like, putative [Lutibacter agarilyticus]|uniref:DNA-binding protein, histone-like, putative n=1 Tax=Lutibacter agarilyticus TaxID=1109740 RepID=A0A238YZK9_9FLAO|nr:HU family DNA-binding protein [Lutibacter agarilyticus]SNR76148.1 DNA-binding protein, histone-like, putative [Lutibacter agarilyticus]